MATSKSLYEIIIVGAGPAGISLGAEAVRSGIESDKILILEKAQTHSWSIRKYYPDDKLVTANYKGSDVQCKGVLCLLDSSKDETLSYLDRTIEDYQLRVIYESSVYEIVKLRTGYYIVKCGQTEYVTKTIAIAIGVLGKPNKPSYKIPGNCLNKVHYDVTSAPLKNQDILVVGGGDSASEYVQYLVQHGNSVTLSYRRSDFSRMNEINRNSLMALSLQGTVKLLLESNIEGLEEKSDRVLVRFSESQKTLIYDQIIYALGGSSPKDFLKTCGIAMTKDGPDVSEFFESSQEGIFLIGDISAGNKGGSINVAFNSAHDAMKEFCRSYLDCRFNS